MLRSSEVHARRPRSLEHRRIGPRYWTTLSSVIINLVSRCPMRAYPAPGGTQPDSHVVNPRQQM